MKELDAVELTRELIRIDSLNPPGNENRATRFLAKILEDAGFEVATHEFATDRHNLIARIGPSPEPTSERLPICFSGHLDTVPLGLQPWSRDPFAAEIEDGKIYGRGSSDMKSGVAAMLVAALRMARHNLWKAGLLLILTGGEETGCVGSESLAMEKGRLGPAGALIVGEPTSNYPVIGHKGAFWLEAVAHGVTAHGSMPEQGVNAITKAARAVLALETFDFGIDPHPVLGGPSLNIGTIRGGINVNSVPDETRIGIDIRTIPGLEHRYLVKRLQQALGDEVELRCAVDARSLWTDPEDPWVRSVFDLLAPVLGNRPEPKGVTYFTDAPALKRALGEPPAMVLGPGEPVMAHQTDEYCWVEKIVEAAAIYEQLAARWCLA